MSEVYVTVNGLQIPNVQQLIVDLETDQRSLIDPLLDTSPTSPVGVLNGIFASPLREAWEGIQVAYDGFNPDAAENFLLDALCAITGTIREAAAPSSFALDGLVDRRLTISLNAHSSANAGTLFSQEGNPSVVFATIENVVNDKPDADTFKVSALCTRTGAIACNAGTLTVIQTPVVGLTAVINSQDAHLGNDQQTDTELRITRVEELAIAGSSTVDAIRAALLAYTPGNEIFPIQQADVHQNVTDAWDANGLPPHSIEALLYDGGGGAGNGAIAHVIWENLGAGIESFGTTTIQTVDEVGSPQFVSFTRVATAPVKIQIVLVYDSTTSLYPGDQAVKDAIKARFDAKVNLKTTTVRAREFISATLDLPGTLDVTSCQLGYVSGSYQASETNLDVPNRTLATLSSTDIHVTSSGGTP